VKERNHDRSGTREGWLAAQRELLKAEKELTRRSDELARQRQDLPWVRVDKEYASRPTRALQTITRHIADAWMWPSPGACAQPVCADEVIEQLS
jgi:predicted dithiol-disulfide oxidoreductase (DUF899 family)